MELGDEKRDLLDFNNAAVHILDDAQRDPVQISAVVMGEKVDRFRRVILHGHGLVFVNEPHAALALLVSHLAIIRVLFAQAEADVSLINERLIRVILRLLSERFI